MGFFPAIWMRVQKKKFRALATHVELIYGLMIGFLSHSRIVAKVALRFVKVKTNTLLNSGEIKVTANLGQL
jgi:hypothetical protein